MSSNQAETTLDPADLVRGIAAMHDRSAQRAATATDQALKALEKAGG